MSGSSISVGVCDHLGLSPLTPFCLRVTEKNGALLLFLWVGRGHKKQRRGGLSCVGVGCFEALMLRYRGMSAPRVPMGCREGFPTGFLWVGSMCFSGSGWRYTKRPPGGAVHQGVVDHIKASVIFP